MQDLIKIYHRASSFPFPSISNKSYPMLEEGEGKKEARRQNKGGCISLSAATPLGGWESESRGLKATSARSVSADSSHAATQPFGRGRASLSLVCASPRIFGWFSRAIPPFRLPLRVARGQIFSPRIPVKRDKNGKLERRNVRSWTNCDSITSLGEEGNSTRYFSQRNFYEERKDWEENVIKVDPHSRLVFNLTKVKCECILKEGLKN